MSYFIIGMGISTVVTLLSDARFTQNIKWVAVGSTSTIIRREPTPTPTPFLVTLTPTPTDTPMITPTPNPTFLWGDLNADGIAGAVDAGLLLRYDVSLIDHFPGYPDIVFPDYPPAADLNGDGVAGAVDAGLLLRYDVFLILSFPADLNEDGYGPDIAEKGEEDDE